MKKFLFVILLAFGSLCGYTQSYEVIHIEDVSNSFVSYCSNDENLLGVIIYGMNCPNQNWTVYDFTHDIYIIQDVCADSIIINKTIIFTGLEVHCICDETYACDVYFVAPICPFPEQIVWKRQHEQTTLDCDSYEGIWSTGEIGRFLTVLEPETYSVTLTDDCGSATYSVEVRDNVELYRATCDLATNKNQVTWLTTPEQSEYITAVKVYRNNELVGTVPYADGVFTDNIGSQNTQWQYYIVGVSVEGDDCPIPSYWKRTIHLDRIQDSQGNLILQWTPYEEESPEKDVVSAYGIYDVVNGIPNHVIDVGNFTNVYTYNPADFHGYGAVAAVFAEKGLEEFAFSNLTKQMLDIDENITEIPVMKIYPNPSNGAFTVECVSDLIVYNVIGQVIAISHATENGIHNFSLGTGIYFVKSDEGAVQKIIVE